MLKLHGIYAPIATPFVGEEVAYDKLEANLKFWLDSKLAGVVVLGSNGEFVLLESAEKERLISFYCEKVAGRKPVVSGTDTFSKLLIACSGARS